MHSQKRSPELIVFSVILGLILLFACPQANADEIRLRVEVDSTIACVGDSLVYIDVYLDTPLDSLAGFTTLIMLDNPNMIEFRMDDEGLSGIDTAGTLISGWEYVNTNSLGNYHNIRITAIANTLSAPFTPPLAPQSGGLLVRLKARVYDDVPAYLYGTSVTLFIVDNLSETNFSDPDGELIGVITQINYDTTWYECLEWDGPTCIDSIESTPESADWFVIYEIPYSFWDSTAVEFVNGAVTVPAPLGFSRGDANGDDDVNVADAVFLIGYVFKGGPAPNPWESGDANRDGDVNVADAVFLINYVFKGGPPPFGC
jgi:hypothetical protein